MQWHAGVECDCVVEQVQVLGLVGCITCADRLPSCAGHLQMSRRGGRSFMLSQLTSTQHSFETMAKLELQVECLSFDNVIQCQHILILMHTQLSNMVAC